MLPSSSGVTQQTIPIMCKILMGINITLFIAELFVHSLVNSYCLSPQRILSYPTEYISSLFLSNFFHLNPIQSGPMGIFHILINMMTLMNIGKYLEYEFGSISFIGITLFFCLFIGPLQIPIAIICNTLSMGRISLLSLYQCGIGFSGILFGYFIIYLKLTPNEEINFYGFKCKKWLLPFIQLLILSFLLKASFIGHLAGIIMGMIYITGIPGCFVQRHNLIKKIENLSVIQCITNRNDFYSSSQQPILSQINIIPCSNNTNSNNISYSRVANNDNNNNNNTSRVEMTCIDGVLVPKSSVNTNNNNNNNNTQSIT